MDPYNQYQEQFENNRYSKAQGGMNMERPTGVTILAALSIISGLIAILGGLALFTVGPGIIGGVVLILGILSLIYGWGLWTLKPWAWMLAIIGAALNLVTALISALSRKFNENKRLGECGSDWHFPRARAPKYSA
jgi:hypothetical protein